MITACHRSDVSIAEFARIRMWAPYHTGQGGGKRWLSWNEVDKYGRRSGCWFQEFH